MSTELSDIKVVFLMADYGHDPTETAIPYAEFKKAGFTVNFATENGVKPECDKKMLKGLSQKILGANKTAISSYTKMTESPEYQSPLSWTSPSFTLSDFSLVFLPGGHDKGVRQVIDSAIIQTALSQYFPQTKKPSRKVVAAICHGVLGLSEAKYPPSTEGHAGKSILHDVTTTALPHAFEEGIFWTTRLFMGDYYKTYGAGSESVETVVKQRLDNPAKQWKSNLSPAPFIVEDDQYNYVSGRFPPDAQTLAEKAINLLTSPQ